MNEGKLNEGLEPIGDAPVSTAMGIAAIALQMAMKYYDMTIIKDGTMYQQYKMEGRNIETAHIDHVFEMAMKIEMHLLTREKAIAELVMNSVVDALKEETEALDDDGDAE